MTSLQIAIDCADPHRLARFWAPALDLQIEDHHDLVEQMVSEGYATNAETITLDGRLAWRSAAACRDPEGRLPRLLFQTVEEPKTVKNRVHMDIHVGPEERDGKVDELVAMGASRLWEGRQGPHSWVTLADPEGNEFCVS